MDIRWTDAFVRYADPAAKMIAAFRLGLGSRPEFKRAVRELETNGTKWELSEEDTLLGEKGLNWWVQPEWPGALSADDASIRWHAICGLEASWHEPVAECRRLIAETQETQGLTEESLQSLLAPRFVKESYWTNLDAALKSGFRPFPLLKDAGVPLEEALLADLFNEHFGELAIQWDVMRSFDRISEPDVKSPEPGVVLRRIERSLHEAICTRLKRRFGLDLWWSEGVPAETRMRCAELHEVENCRYAKESCMNLLDLSQIAKKNFADLGKTFEDALGVKGKNGAEDWFGKLNKLRNLVAHPLRGDLSNKERHNLLECDQKVATLCARLDALLVE